MIEVTDINGRKHYLKAETIMRITEADTSSRWHGIRSIVKTTDGCIIEAAEEAVVLSSRVEAELLASGQAKEK